MVEDAMRRGGMLRGGLIGLIGIAVLAPPASAEVRIYVTGKAAPVVTDQIFEEDGWVLYEENGSGYLFSTPRERVQKIEIVQGGIVRTLQMTPSGERFRDFHRYVFLSVLAAGDKHGEDVFKRIQEEVKNLAATRSAMTVPPQQPGGIGGISPEATVFATALQEDRINGLLEEAGVIYRRNDRLLQEAGRYERGPKPKYYFYR